VLEQPPFSQFKANYDSAQVNQEMESLLRQVSEGVDWLVFFGSWCGDSRLQVPRFLKVADAAGISQERIRLYGLDRSKKSSEGLAEMYQIRLVPTFICLKGGKEIGRITETPTIGMEADMLTILSAAP
jgi:thiol-disulfide isomerase/thioredoxin